ncbi:MAG: HD-GYP domain-containing protein [Desulfamplus sp.]
MNRYEDKEITKIVCFCASEESSVAQYLQNEQSYLVKLCRDAQFIEQIVDAINPDIILIHYTENLSVSEQSERLIELEDVVEPESADCNDAFCSKVENADVPDIADVTDAIEAGLPVNSHLMPEYLSNSLAIRNISNKAQVLFLFDSDPGTNVRNQCLLSRCDLMVAPFHFEELKFRISLYVNQKELNYRVAWQQEALNRAVEHIDNLKQIIVETRKNWSRENELLHNSLKQINMMSNDRDILQNQLRVSRAKLVGNIKGVNSFLCSMVESRNEHQKGHSKRVADICEFVAETLGVEQKSVRLLKNAAMLHEVGMLLIPSSILNKEPLQWSEYEKNMMLHHPSNGAAYLDDCPGFEKIAEVIRHLHENSDGTGYPQGLKKRYIPLLSKILAGADVLDQIWIDNPYASVDRILKILEQEYAGSRLDPSIVNVLEKYAVTVLNFQTVFCKTDDIEQPDSDKDQSLNSRTRLKEIGVYQLTPGMVLGTGLFTKTGTKLFAAGTTLTEDSIRMMEKYTKEYPINETVFIKVDL